MVRIVENWARIQGTVVGVRDVSDPSGYLEVELRLDAIQSVPRARNLFTQAPGETIAVLMSHSLVERLSIRDGAVVAADVRRADLHRSYVHPERVSVEAGPDGDPLPRGQVETTSDAPPGDAATGADTPTVTRDPAPDPGAERAPRRPA